MDLLQAALDLALNRGFKIVPCNVNKNPLLARFEEATTDPVVIRRWWEEKFPGASVGIYTEGLAVIDVDVKNAQGANGFEALKRLESKFGALPETLRSRTGSGGAHYFFTLPPGVRCFRPQIRPHGIDLRSGGGYVIVPPSPHPSGRNYVWENESHALALAPEWLLGLNSRDQ